jgi:16S rRNA (guanine527-N7)-methyltransferase
MMVHPLPNSAAALDSIVSVSRETKERLAIYVALLEKWQKSQNLVAPSTLRAIWTRHVADSVQALAVAPDARRWVDIGSGAGFPGLVTAVLLRDEPGAVVHLVESNSGKAAFLRTVARETGAVAQIHPVRIDAFMAGFAESVDAVSARALAPLPELLSLAEPLLARGARGVFHKGQDFVSEREKATLSWDFDLVEYPSRIEETSRMIVVSHVRRRAKHV